MRSRKKLRRLAQWLAALGISAAIVVCSCSLGTRNVIIDWVDFIRFHGITYLSPFSQVGRSLQESDLGPIFAAVQFRLEGNVHDPSYQSKDGDAAFLDAGTPVYTLWNYSPQFRLAAHRDGQLILYEADTNPHAHKGADLLDIAGRVQYIGVNSEQDGVTEVGAIKDPQQIDNLVDMVMNAPVDQSYRSTDTSGYLIAFHPADGTATVRGYEPASGELSRGILLPSSFATAVEGAITPSS